MREEKKTDDNEVVIYFNCHITINNAQREQKMKKINTKKNHCARNNQTQAHFD